MIPTPSFPSVWATTIRRWFLEPPIAKNLRPRGGCSSGFAVLEGLWPSVSNFYIRPRRSVDPRQLCHSDLRKGFRLSGCDVSDLLAARLRFADPVLTRPPPRNFSRSIRSGSSSTDRPDQHRALDQR